MASSEVFNMKCEIGMQRYPDKHFDLAVVDPPYNIARQQLRGVGSRIDKTGKMNSWNNKAPGPEYFAELFRVSKHQIIWGDNNYAGLPVTEYFCIWHKKQTVPNFADAEYAWVSPSLRKPAKVFTYGIHRHNTEIDRIHPTQKPVALYEWLLLTYAQPGFKILDTHMGSQSSRIACHKMGFDYTGFELDPEYFADGNKRFDLFKRQLTMF